MSANAIVVSTRANNNSEIMRHFLKYLVVWISQNLAIPFWTLGHFHLMTTVYEDIYEIIASFEMNILVATGFIISYLEERKNIKKDKP